MLVWLNGNLIERESASIPIHDAGFQHGVGLFETMAARNGRVFRAAAHVERLAGSARQLLLTDRLHAGPLAEAIALTVRRSGLESARVRLTVTGGNLAQPIGQRRHRIDPTILIDVQPATEYPQESFERGVMVTICEGRHSALDPMAGHKTLNYWPRIRALQLAAAKGAGESLWFTTDNRLSGGSVSNVFLVRDGTLLTPPARGDGQGPAAVLPGITRGTVLELAASAEIAASIRPLTIEDLLGADEAFLTNSSWGVLPVVAIERHTVGSGEVGGLTRRLRSAWLALVEQETAAVI
jgi:branched-subunit amino acid aminotransferase/4-amino-4-deoxychorismate lyase